jgi:hypothetical protein
VIVGDGGTIGSGAFVVRDGRITALGGTAQSTRPPARTSI